MAQNDKGCMTLAFNKKIKQSHRNKVKEFWKFLDSADPLKPYTAASNERPPDVRDTDETFPKVSKRLWFDQLQVFQEYEFDKVALAATETCKICHIGAKCRSSKFADTVKESYEQLLNDIKIYDAKLESKTGIATDPDQKKSSIP